MYLVCLRPPSNVVAVVAALHESLLTRTGVASQYALPICVPLAFTASCPPPPPRPGRLLTAWSTDGPFAVGGAAFLEVAPLAQVQSFAGPYDAIRTPGPLPAVCGIYLGGPEPLLDAGDMISALGCPKPVRFTTAVLSCMEIGFDESSEQWWSGFEWVEVWAVKLLKPVTPHH